MSTIRDSRIRQGVGMRELGRRLGVTGAAISQMEASEDRGTIMLSTLRRAHQALDQIVMVEAAPASTERRVSATRREERVSRELHRTLAKKLIDNPRPILALAPTNIERMSAVVHGSRAHAWLDDWRGLVSDERNVPRILQLIVDDSEYASDMRQNSPFAGALTTEERLEAIRRAKATAE